MDTQLSCDTGKPKVFAVDDQQYCHALVTKAIGDFCSLISLGDGESALAAASASPPDLILLDVEMPGIDGYAVCRQLKACEVLAEIPVLFLSAHDEIEDRLKGFEAGGQDYITKPFNLQELKSKVQFLLDQSRQRAELKSMAESATGTAMMVMTNMGELGVLLEGLRSFNSCKNSSELAQAVVTCASSFGLNAAVLVQTSAEKVTAVSGGGAASPLEMSVIEHMRNMRDRIISFKTRLSVTYNHVTLLISNMPVHDEDLCGRLRDHLAALVEGADVRVQGLLAARETGLRQAIEQTVASMTEALDELDQQQRLYRLNIGVAVTDLRDSFEQALLSVALSDAQEAFLQGVVQKRVEKIVSLQSDEAGMQNKLTTITKSLKSDLSKNS